MDATEVGIAEEPHVGSASSCTATISKKETSDCSAEHATKVTAIECLRGRVEAILKTGKAANYEKFKTEFVRAMVGKKFTRACCEMNLIDPDLSQAEWHALMDLMNEESAK